MFILHIYFITTSIDTNITRGDLKLAISTFEIELNSQKVP